MLLSFILLGIINGIFAIYFIIRACALNNVSYLVIGFGFLSYFLMILYYYI